MEVGQGPNWGYKLQTIQVKENEHKYEYTCQSYFNSSTLYHILVDYFMTSQCLDNSVEC
jgi:redox-regulated HSP33 family molecular chaperone